MIIFILLIFFLFFMEEKKPQTKNLGNSSPEDAVLAIADRDSSILREYSHKYFNPISNGDCDDIFKEVFGITREMIDKWAEVILFSRSLADKIYHEKMPTYYKFKGSPYDTLDYRMYYILRATGLTNKEALVQKSLKLQELQQALDRKLELKA